jgi:hypothetical protein
MSAPNLALDDMEERQHHGTTSRSNLPAAAEGSISGRRNGSASQVGAGFRELQLDADRTSGMIIALWLVVVVVLLAFGATGLQKWDEGELVPDPTHFTWLVVFITSTPLAVMLGVAASIQLHHYRMFDRQHAWVPWARACVFAALAVLGIVTSVTSVNKLALDVLRCGVVFCTGLNNTLPAGPTK